MAVGPVRDDNYGGRKCIPHYSEASLPYLLDSPASVSYYYRGNTRAVIGPDLDCILCRSIKPYVERPVCGYLYPTILKDYNRQLEIAVS